jgi:hypothetical protein
MGGSAIREPSKLASAIVLAAGLSLCAPGARAQDDRFVNDIDAKQRKACTPDVQRLCNQYVPDVDQIVACLKRERASLSAACGEVFAVPEQCKADVQSLCKDYLVVIPSVAACLKRELDQGNLNADCAQSFAAMQGSDRKAEQPGRSRPKKAAAKRTPAQTPAPR